MCSLKEKAMRRISKLADVAIENDPFGEDVDKADVISAFPELMEKGIVTAEEYLSVPESKLLRSLSIIVAAEALAYSGSLLTPEQLDTLEEIALGKNAGGQVKCISYIQALLSNLSDAIQFS